MPPPIVLSHFQVGPALAARREGKHTAAISPDLGLSTVVVSIHSEGITFPTGASLSWEQVETIADSENACFLLQADSLSKIQLFSEATNRLYTLFPTERAPTMLVSGIPMHRIKGTGPWEDTLSKVKTIAPIVGRVLDTTTGLGYTAIAAAQTADHVITVELDPAATEIARLNPWSQPLFEDTKIERIIGDSFYVVRELAADSFTRIVHDPPRFSLAGELYSEEFYRQLYRVCRRGGKVFHYIGDPESKSGKGVTRGVVSRLKAVGFQRIELRAEAFGVIAAKEATSRRR